MSEPVRPLNVLHTARSIRIDGIAQVVLRTVGSLDPARVRSHVCAVHGDRHLLPAFREAGVEPTFLGYRGPRSAPAVIARLARLIRRRRIDVVHANQTVDLVLAGTAARLCGVPVVATLHWLAEGDTSFIRSERAPSRLAKRTARALADRFLVSRLVAVSAAVRDTHARELGRAFPHGRVEVVLPGLDFNAPSVPPSRVAELRRELGLDGAHPVLLNVGRLHPVKGQRHLIPMMARVRARLPSAVLLVAGGGDLHDELVDEAAAHGLADAVRLLGPRLDVPDLLAVCDLLVLASESEAAPLPLIEAARAGKPVVAAAVGGVPEIVVDGVTGYVVPPRDPDALAGAVLRVFEELGRAAALGSAARRIGRERFDAAVWARALERIYDSVATTSRSATTQLWWRVSGAQR